MPIGKAGGRVIGGLVRGFCALLLAVEQERFGGGAFVWR